ncbi:MAG: DinB family protein [Acidobacteriia bacterium]|nr:DinB family protein [Terriglobia bacterium]
MSSMREHLGRLFAYDDWANREVLATLNQTGGRPPRSVQLMAHIFSAQRLWLERLQSQKQSLPVWPDFSLDECEAQAAELPRLWKNYLAQAENVDRPIVYKNSKGESWVSQSEDVLLHVVMHSVYHRGQIATDMRAAGFPPAYTDFIHAVRQGFVEEV